ncbi:MAG TPA: CHASE4 domain-containing protein [Candidatus Acidoferrales bacterium]
MRPLHLAQLRVPSSLRRKTLLIIGITMLGLVGGLFVLSRIVLMRGFAILEEDFAGRDIARASSALANELNTLDQTTSEYGSWDLTYDYARGMRPSYIKTEFPASTFQQLKISFVVILDARGRRLFAKGFDLTHGGEKPIPAGLDNHLEPGSLLLNLKDAHSKVAGVLDLPGGPALIVSRPILASDSSGPIAGTMVMGRLLDVAEIQHLGDLTLAPIEAQTLSSTALSPDFRTAAAAISKSSPNFIAPLDSQSLAAYQELDDIYGRPALLIRVLLPRTIYEQGHTSLVQFLLLLIAAGFVFGAATLYLLERVVISRIANLSENITQIGASGDLSARLDVPGHDELAFLGVAINGMLEDLEKSQIERHEGRARLAMMIERMPAVLWTTDKELRYTSSMGAGLDSLGVKSGGLTGKTLAEYFETHDPQHPSIAAHWRALAGESLTYELHWQKRIFESHVRPLRGPDGEIIGVIGVALDITDRKHLADQLRQSQKLQAVGELAGGVAHDFNNLLMVVKGHAEMLLDRLPGASAERQSPARQNAEQIQQAAERAAGLTRQLLAFSRMQVLQPRVLDLNEVVAGMIQMVSRVIGANIELAFLPGANLGRVKADPSQIEQVALNLVVNARDAMPDGGRLTIETSNVHLDRDYATEHAVVDPGDYVMLTVSDSGIGMDAATQARIFEPFFTTKSQGRGTGLGLATVYGVVKQSGGYVWVYSEVGHGTTFKVYLPMVQAPVEKKAPEKPESGHEPGTETILFVEDEQSVRELVREYLTARGYQVLDAGDGVEALKIASTHKGKIHLLITDVVMPRLSGRELAARLAATRSDLKVLYISGYTDDSVFRHGVLEGGMAFLQKPFNLKALATKIRGILDGVPIAVAPGGNSDDD